MAGRQLCFLNALHVARDLSDQLFLRAREIT